MKSHTETPSTDQTDKIDFFNDIPEEILGIILTEAYQSPKDEQIFFAKKQFLKIKAPIHQKFTLNFFEREVINPQFKPVALIQNTRAYLLEHFVKKTELTFKNPNEALFYLKRLHDYLSLLNLEEMPRRPFERLIQYGILILQLYRLLHYFTENNIVTFTKRKKILPTHAGGMYGGVIPTEMDVELSQADVDEMINSLTPCIKLCLGIANLEADKQPFMVIQNAYEALRHSFQSSLNISGEKLFRQFTLYWVPNTNLGRMSKIGEKVLPLIKNSINELSAINNLAPISVPEKSYPKL